MENKKIFYILDDNGRIVDCIIGDESKKQVAISTKEFIEKNNYSEWIKYRIIDLPLEGSIHKDHVNIITTIKLNGQPCRAIANNFYNIIEIVESYLTLENDYRHFDFTCEFVRV